MNCQKYKTKALVQKRTWLTRIPSYIKYYHVIGDETLEQDYNFDNENQILWLKVPDDYNSLPKKVIFAYQAVFETFQFKYLFKTDDDQILINDNLFNIITKLVTSQNNEPKKYHYGGSKIIVKKNYLSQYHKIHTELPENLPIYSTTYCTGRFYFLSNEAIINLISKKDDIKKEYFEDYAIGYYLDDSFKQTMLNIKTDNFFIDIEKSDYAGLLQ